MLSLKTPGLAAVMATGLLLAAAPAQAEMMKFMAELTGAAEVPPVEGAATGTAEVTLDTEAMTVAWTFTHEGLSGDMTGAHIHGPASATEAAPPVIDVLMEPAEGTTEEMAEDDAMAGSADITAEQAADLQAGNYYFNVHTEANPDGEIRGQLMLAE